MLNSWQFYAFASAFFAGLTAVLAKVGVANIPSNLATLLRTLVVCAFLFFLVFFRQEWINPLTLNKRSLIFLILSGLATGLSWLLYFRALHMGPAALVASVDKLSLLFAVVLAVIFLGEHLGARQWIGIVFIATGTLLVAFK